MGDLNQLFRRPNRSLVSYHHSFGVAQKFTVSFAKLVFSWPIFCSAAKGLLCFSCDSGGDDDYDSADDTSGPLPG